MDVSACLSKKRRGRAGGGNGMGKREEKESL